MPTDIILDSSVVAKWFFPAEEDSKIAIVIKDLFVSKNISISAPLLLCYEINNLIRTAVKSLRINKDLAKDAYQGFLELDIVYYSSTELMGSTLDKAIMFDISSYDAAYIALSEYLNIPFYTADRKLLQKNIGDLVKDLREFYQ